VWDKESRKVHRPLCNTPSVNSIEDAASADPNRYPTMNPKEPLRPGQVQHRSNLNRWVMELVSSGHYFNMVCN
jgi:hypothetical protein